MAEKANKTAIQKTADAARAVYSKASDANTSTPNAANKAALDKAKAARDVAVKAESRERFLNVGVKRTRKARATIKQLIKVANRKSYDFNDAEAAKIVEGLRLAVNEVETAFRNTTVAAAQGDDFTL